MKIVENWGMIDAGKGKASSVRALVRFNPKKKTFMASYLEHNGYGGIKRVSGVSHKTIKVRPSTITTMQGKWDDHTFYLYKRHKRWWAFVHHEGQLFRVKYSELLYDQHNQPRETMWEKVSVNKEITAFDALMMVAL
jgi:hypothetical protein